MEVQREVYRYQGYPFPLMLMGYPEEGDFVGLVGDFRSSSLTRKLYKTFQMNHTQESTAKIEVEISTLL